MSNKHVVAALFEHYRAMRESQPVARDDVRDIWHVYRHADVQRVLSDYEVFSSDGVRMRTRVYGEGKGGGNPVGSIVRMDPPAHHAMRRAANAVWSPQKQAALEPTIRRLAEDLLDRVADAGKMDIVRDLSHPLPVAVMAELMGIPADMRASFRRWSSAVATVQRELPAEELAAAARELQQMLAYFTDLAGERQRRPADDLMSALLHHGEPMSTEVVISFCGLLVLAGNDTTTNLLGSMMVCFDDHPEVVARLRANRTLVPSVIEEATRYYSPVKTSLRVTTQDTTLSGHHIPAGEILAPNICSANRDDAEYPDGDRFDIDRASKRHIAFGKGIHFCLGAPLARLEAQVMLDAMLDRLPGTWRLADEPLALIPSLIMFGFQRIPMTWEP